MFNAGDATAPLGMSAVTRDRKVGAAALPVVGPANTAFAVCVDKVKVKAGVVLEVATPDVNKGERSPAVKLVTVPPPPTDPVKSRQPER